MKRDDKKTALRLLEKYADSYHLLEEENKALLLEIQDLKANLTINKGIIEGVFNLKDSDDKSVYFLKKLKEESTSLNEKIGILILEKEELKRKLANTEQIKNAKIMQLNEQNNRLATKLFIVDNKVLELESIIESKNKKLEKCTKTILNTSNNSVLNKQFQNEVLIIEPSKAVNYINDELQMYKNIYNNLNSYIKELQYSLHFYKKVNDNLEDELDKVKKEIKIMQIVSTIEGTSNYPKTELIKPITLDKDDYLKTIQTNVASVRFEGTNVPPKRNKSDNNLLTKINTIDSRSILNMEIFKQYKNLEKINDNKKESMMYADDWIDTLKYSGMTQEEFIKFSRNRFVSKLVDSIEYLYKIVLDKNLQIKILQNENENLNIKNLVLNKENIELAEKNLFLAEKIEKNDDLVKRFVNKRPTLLSRETGMDSSLVNNTSRVILRENEVGNPTPKFNNVNNIKMPNLNFDDSNLEISIDSHEIERVTETIRSIITSNELRGCNIAESFISDNDRDVQLVINVGQIR